MTNFTESNPTHAPGATDTPSYQNPFSAPQNPYSATQPPHTPTGSSTSWSSYIPSKPITGDDERNWAMGAHLSSFVALFFFGLSFLGPLTVLLVAGNRSPFVRRHAVEALNFNVSVLLYAVTSIVLMIVLIGIPLFLGLVALYLVTVIVGAVAAARGEDYRYPLSLRFVK